MADVATLGLQVDSAPVERGSRSLEKFSKSALNAANANFAAARADEAKAASSLAAAKATNTSSAADIKAAQGALARARANTANAKAMQAVIVANQKAALSAKAANNNVSNFGGSFGGLAAQFQDVGVSIAGGMDPVLVTFQQGTQIAGQMEMAVRSGESALRVLGSAFASLLSPVSLISIGLTAIAGIGLQYVFSEWGDKAEETDDILKRVADRMERIRDLGVDLAKFNPETGFSAGLRTNLVSEQIKQIRSDAEAARRQLEGVFGNLNSGFRIGGFGRTSLAAVAEELDKVGKNGKWAVERLQQFARQAATGQISAEQFAVRSGAMFDSIVKNAPEARDAVDKLRTAMLGAVESVIELQGNADIAGNRLLEINKNVLVSFDVMKSAYEAGAKAAQRMAREQNVAKTAAENVRKELELLERQWRADFVLNVSVQGDVQTVGQLLSAIGAPTDLVNGAYDAEDQRMKLQGTYQAMADGRQSPSEENLSATYSLADNARKVAASAAKKSGSAADKAAASYDKLVQSANQFIETQTREHQSIGMTAEAASRLKYEQELLNKAANDNISLTPAQTANLKNLAAEMAAAETKTNGLKAAFDFAKETATGFFSDIASNLRQGKSFWESFAQAGLNAVNKIADKLIEFGASNLFDYAFGGLRGGGAGGGGGGGFFGSLLSGLGGLFGFAKGGAFNAGNVIPFANGGVVTSATGFAMSGGRMGVMGEAGPEAIMPLKRGKDGKLGVATNDNRSGGSTTVRIEMTPGLVASIVGEATQESGKQTVQLIQSSAGPIAKQGASQARKDFSEGKWDKANASRYGQQATVNAR